MRAGTGSPPIRRGDSYGSRQPALITFAAPAVTGRYSQAPSVDRGPPRRRRTEVWRDARSSGSASAGRRVGEGSSPAPLRRTPPSSSSRISAHLGRGVEASALVGGSSGLPDSPTGERVDLICELVCGDLRWTAAIVVRQGFGLTAIGRSRLWTSPQSSGRSERSSGGSFLSRSSPATVIAVTCSTRMRQRSPPLVPATSCVRSPASVQRPAPRCAGAPPPS
jgi:hypothetical protein